ncbi:hypothetical protein CBL_10719 [Carabus blaptoides fortunei]
MELFSKICRQGDPPRPGPVHLLVQQHTACPQSFAHGTSRQNEEKIERNKGRFPNRPNEKRVKRRWSERTDEDGELKISFYKLVWEENCTELELKEFLDNEMGEE